MADMTYTAIEFIGIIAAGVFLGGSAVAMLVGAHD